MMNYYMYICPNCKKVFKSKGSESYALCSQCSGLLLDMKVTFDEWNNLTKDDKDRIKDKTCVGLNENIPEINTHKIAETRDNNKTESHSFFDDNLLKESTEREEYCANCGTKIKHNSNFCIKCGRQINGVASKKINSTWDNEGYYDAPFTNVELLRKIRKNIKKILVSGSLLIVLLAVIIIVVTNEKKTINLNKYLTIETSGYNGYGTAKSIIDWELIFEKYGEYISFTDAAYNEYSAVSMMLTSPKEKFMKSIRIETDENRRLSNNDEINYTWKVEDDISKYFNCKLRYKDGKHVVSGLKDISTFDPFSKLEVDFSGVAPQGEISLNYVGIDLNNSDFVCSKASLLDNGERIKITLSHGSDYPEYYIDRLDKVPEIYEKEYVVDGLEKYLIKAESIDSEILRSMQIIAMEEFNNANVDSLGEGEEIVSIDYIGSYFLVANNPKDDYQNYLYLLYKARVHNTYSNSEKSFDEENDVYWYTRFQNLILGNDGKIQVDLSKRDTPSHYRIIDSHIQGFITTVDWYYMGYESLEELYNDRISGKMDSYSVYNNAVEERKQNRADDTDDSETENKKIQNSDYPKAKSYQELLDQLKEAILSGNTTLVEKKMVYEDESGMLKLFPHDIVDYFVSYMSSNNDKLSDLMVELDNDKYSGLDGDEYIVKLPYIKFVVNMGYDNTTISVSGFKKGTVDSGESADIAPLLPCEYILEISNPDWTETVTRIVEADINEPQVNINIYP